MLRFILYTLLISILFISCNTENKDRFSITELPLKTQSSGEPNLFVTEDGVVFLSWIENENDTVDVLRFSSLESDKWSEPLTIASGSDWFVNWADFPSLIGFDEHNLVAHWLQKSDSGTYDYDIRVSQSKDGGKNWSLPIIPHRDSINAEHGFVSMIPTPGGNTFLTWLDGRNTKNETNNAMTLRTAELTSSGELVNERALDNRVCDCCQTGATWTDKGPIVVYRDRSESEIRDISIVRNVDGNWTIPQTLNQDNWKISGCPVNGPSIDSEGTFVSVAWFTNSEDKPKVLFSRSTDYGRNFTEPIRIHDKGPLGRVDVVQMEDGNSLVLWMENRDYSAVIKLVKVDNNGNVGEALIVSENSASRKSGFPRMVKVENDAIIMAWTDVKADEGVVKVVKINY